MFFSAVLCLFLGVPVFNLDLPPAYKSILDDLSWTLKLKLLKDYLNTTTTTSTTPKIMRRVGMESLIMSEPQELDAPNRRTNEKSIYINNGIEEKAIAFEETSIYKNPERVDDNVNTKYDTQNRRFRVKVKKSPEKYGYFIDPSEELVGRRQEGVPPKDPPFTKPPATDDENDMRMKLFRLMYETVRDSDLKVKRAELIKSHYHNYTSFDVGYLMGDVTDKYNIMQDISRTLERLYHDWKPLEHINAYEQIANQAIEISHLIDMIKHMSKRNSTFI